jgi:inosine-uridine nucleoside N-ribohydrolase
LIDTDAAADDVIALLLALDCKGVSIEAITVALGACAASQSAQNVLFVLEHIKASVPVFEDTQTPLFGTG